jgi:MFS family permease
MARVFYGWWIVLAAFLNFFFAVSMLYYAFPLFYLPLVHSLGFTRAQVIQGFLLGFLVVGLPFGFVAGALIDRIGAREVIRCGIGFIGLSLVLMGSISRLWQFELLCITEILGFVLTGPIPNQVLISNWFQAKRGRAMGYVYVGAGLGGAVAPILTNFLVEHFGWRNALRIIGVLIIAALFPVAQWVTRSAPRELGLFPDGAVDPEEAVNVQPRAEAPTHPQCDPTPFAHAERAGIEGLDVRVAVRTANFWLILVGSTLTIGTIGAVIQHLVLFLEDQGYSASWASRASSALLISSLAGRVIVGYCADRYLKKNVMALFYLVLAVSIPLLFWAHKPIVVWAFALLFGFTMGADYMLIPLVTAECFGLAALGKLLALIIMGYTLGQWFGPWLAGRIFDVYHSYNLAWGIIFVAGLLGSATIWAVSPARAHHVSP